MYFNTVWKETDFTLLLSCLYSSSFSSLIEQAFSSHILEPIEELSEEEKGNIGRCQGLYLHIIHLDAKTQALKIWSRSFYCTASKWGKTFRFGLHFQPICGILSFYSLMCCYVFSLLYCILSIWIRNTLHQRTWKKPCLYVSADILWSHKSTHMCCVPGATKIFISQYLFLIPLNLWNWMGKVPILKTIFNNKENIIVNLWMWNIYVQNIFMVQLGSC